jgi:mannose-6-phosphate isomerase-like protein (cupin superfamily)
MKHLKTGKKRRKFDLIARTRDVQAAMMTLRSGDASDEDPDNEHPRSEQWLFVISGSCEAKIGKRRGQLRRIKFETGSLLLVEKGELHQIQNTGKRSMKTINFYAPPAFDEDGEPMGSLRGYLRALGR